MQFGNLNIQQPPSYQTQTVLYGGLYKYGGHISCSIAYQPTRETKGYIRKERSLAIYLWNRSTNAILIPKNSEQKSQPNRLKHYVENLPTMDIT